NLLKRYVANLVGEIRVDMPLERVTHFVAIGGDVRFAASQIKGGGSEERKSMSRDEFVMFCEQIELLDEEALAERFRLPAVEAETLAPALLVYRALLERTDARHITVSDVSLRAGVLIDMTQPGGRLGSVDFEKQVLASADALGLKYRYDRAHGRHVAMLSTQLFDALMEEHALGGRERLRRQG